MQSTARNANSGREVQTALVRGDDILCKTCLACQTIRMHDRHKTCVLRFQRDASTTELVTKGNRNRQQSSIFAEIGRAARAILKIATTRTFFARFRNPNTFNTSGRQRSDDKRMCPERAVLSSRFSSEFISPAYARISGRAAHQGYAALPENIRTKSSSGQGRSLGRKKMRNQQCRRTRGRGLKPDFVTRSN